MPWSERVAAEQPVNEAPVRSTFAPPSARGAAPSAAFAPSNTRFAPSGREVTPGPGEYKPLQASNRINRSSSFGSRSKRFVGIKMEDTPAPGSFTPKPGAFDSASRKPRIVGAGFGSRTERPAHFEKAKEQAPPPGAYDAPAQTGAFTDRTDRRRSSAAFASRSSRFAGPVGDVAGPDPTAYNPTEYGSMAQAAKKTFNKMSVRGGGSFGNAPRRMSIVDVTDGPAPGDYGGAESTFGAPSDRRAAARPSSAFASKSSNHDSYIRKTEAPTGPSAYDAHAHTGMAATAKKSFNRLARSGSFGPRAERKMGERGTGEVPGPGSFAPSDPLKPTFERMASKASGHRTPRSASFASTSVARPSATTWAEGGERGV